jgi:PHP family Zn ribbon phosphoesterase
MIFAADLHIHSALSPCADNEMTPNNIVNMAFLKGLDFIAVTDHNSVENIRAVLKCAESRDIIAVPGMELETNEEVHLVCLFPDVEAAFFMQEKVYRSLPDMKNREDIYGPQLIMDEEDAILGSLDRLLLTASGLGVYEVFSMVREAGGAVIPAHVDRQSYSMLSNLGAIPEDLDINYLEVSRDCDLYSFKKTHPSLAEYSFLRSSDAHYLKDIFERETVLELEERSIHCLLEKLRTGGQVPCPTVLIPPSC